MGIAEQIEKDIVGAMRSRDELRLSTLRMAKAAIKNKEKEAGQRAPLDDQEVLQILSTLIKQRRDSVDQFQKGGRQEMADKEAAEIVLIEHYMPKAMGAEEIIAAVKAAIGGNGLAHHQGNGISHEERDGQAAGHRRAVEGKMVSEAVKKQLGG